jgi:protein-arginine kinase
MIKVFEAGRFFLPRLKVIINEDTEEVEIRFSIKFSLSRRLESIAQITATTNSQDVDLIRNQKVSPNGSKNLP